MNRLACTGPLCPLDATHGPLLDWPSERWGFFCPNQRHDGDRERPPTRALFTTGEAEAGAINTTPRSEQDHGPRPARSRAPRARTAAGRAG